MVESTDGWARSTTAYTLFYAISPGHCHAFIGGHLLLSSPLDAHGRCENCSMDTDFPSVAL